MGNIIFPDPTKWYVKVLRFLNILDDSFNMLSPVKLNTWAANVGAISTMVATIFSWMGGHMTGIETLWTGSIAWLSQAHVTHHMDKSQRNKVKLELSKTNPGEESAKEE